MPCIGGLPDAASEFAALESAFARRVEHADGVARLEEPRLGDLPAAPDWGAADPTLTLQDFLYGNVAPRAFDRLVTGKGLPWFKHLVTAGVALSKTAPAGAELTQLSVRKGQLFDQLAGRWLTELDSILGGLTKEEIDGGIAAGIERGAALRPEAQQATRRLRALSDAMLREAQRLGLKIPEVLDNYFPHVFDWAEMTTGHKLIQGRIKKLVEGGMVEEQAARVAVSEEGRQLFSRSVQGMMAEGKTATEAFRLLDRFISRNGERLAGNLERERLNVQGYVTNARHAYAVSIWRNARRIAEARVYGPKSEHANALIERVFQETQSRTAWQFAQDFLDLDLGVIRQDFGEIGRQLMNAQQAKLSLSFLTNFQQNLNTLLKVGVRDFMRSVLFYAKSPRAAQLHAQEVGAFTDDLFHRVMSGTQLIDDETLLTARGALKVKQRAEEWLSYPFRLVERINRSVATLAGEYHFDSLMERLRLGDRAAGVALKELGLDGERLLNANAGTLTETRAFAGKALSDITQFTTRVDALPLWAQRTPLGRFVIQFKRFALNQAQFVTGELKHFRDDPVRAGRMLVALATVYPMAGAAVAIARKHLMGPTWRTDAIDRAFAEPDFRNYVAAASAGFATSGAMGILSDVSASAATGNKFTLQSFVIPPAASSIMDAITTVTAVGDGIANRDPKRFRAAARTLLSQAGGVGAAIRERVIPAP